MMVCEQDSSIVKHIFPMYVCILHYSGKLIVERFRSSISYVTDDIHGKLMAQYREVPEWWYD